MAVNDSYSGTEDTPLTPSGSGTLISGDFEPGTEPEDGFTYLDDPFGTSRPNNASGSWNPTAGNPGGCLEVDLGRTNATNFSGGWRRTFTLTAPATVTVSFDWRVGTRGGLEMDEFCGFVVDVNGTRYGSEGTAPALFVGRLYGQNNANPTLNTSWANASFNIPLGAGTHTLTLGGFVNKTTVPEEHGLAWVDNVVVSQPAGLGSVLANDTGGAVTAEVVTQPTKGTLEFESDGAFTYTPNLNTNGVDTFTYRASDGTSWSAPATVTLNMAPVNDAPVATDDSYSVNEDTTLTVPAAQGVLGNDTDVDSATLTAVRVTNPASGLLTLTPNGSLSYTPPPNFSGTRTFTYRANDGALDSNIATVTLTVNPVNDPPTGLPDTYKVLRNTPLVITDVNGTVSTERVLASAVRDGSNAITTPGSVWKYWDRGQLPTGTGTTWRNLAFDDSTWGSGPSELGYGDRVADSFPEATEVSFGTDPANKHITTYFRKVVNVTDVWNITGVAMQVMRDDGIIVYLNGNRIYRNNIAADPAFSTLASNGSAQELVFLNAANMGTGASQNWETAPPSPSQLVEGNNIFAAEVHQDQPSSSDISFDISYVLTRTINQGLLKNDTDIEGDPLTAVVATQPANGTVTVNPNGTFTYQPNLGFIGTDSFTYRASDGSAQSSPITVTLIVEAGPNAPPITTADAYEGTEDTTLNISAAAGVLANDIDPEQDPFTAVLLTQASKGTVTLNPNGSFTYVPNPDTNGTDSFTYRATDGAFSQATTVTLTIAAVNDAPTAVNDSYGGEPGQVLSIPASIGVLANDADVDNTNLTAVLVAPPSSGTFSLAPNGSFSFTPATAGTFTFTYRASDGTLTSNLATVTLVINAAPVAAPDSYTATEDTPLTIPAPGVLGNDSDPENQPLSAQIVSQPARGSVVLNANGSFTFTPQANVTAPDSFTYRAFDGLRTSAETTVNLTITPVNDAPTVANDHYTVGKNGSINIAQAQGVLANDSDIDSPSFTAILVSTTANGTLTLNPNGSFTYTPATDFTGTDSFTYRATDGSAISTTATVTIEITDPGADIVINEIMFRPASTFPEPVGREYIELYNRGTATVNLSGWTFSKGVTFTFPAGRTLAPGAYLVVTANVATFQAAYPGVTNVIGGWVGGLSNSGETIALKDALGNEYDSVSYATEGDWAERYIETTYNGWDWRVGSTVGRSLELRNPNISNDNGQNWAPSANPNGSPGAPNAALTANIAPIIKDVKHTPAVPKTTDMVLVSCELNDETPNQNLAATLWWRDATSTTPGPWNSVPMSTDGDETWFAPIYPSATQANLSIVEFYVSATDGTNTRTWPAATSIGQVANCQFQFDNEPTSDTADMYRLILTAAENQAYLDTTVVDSQSNKVDRQFNTTVIFSRGQETSIRYRAGMRIRGNSSRDHTIGGQPATPLRVNITEDEKLNGVTAFNLNPKAPWLQYLGMRCFEIAGLRAPDVVPVELRRNGIERSNTTGNTPTHGMWVFMEDYNGDFIDEHYPLANTGGVYKKGRPDEFWRTFNAPAHPDTTVDGWIKQNNKAANDWSDIRNFMQVWQTNAAPHFFGANPGDVNSGTWAGTPFDSTQYENLEAIADFDQWARWFAVMTFIMSFETNISNGQDDDYAIYMVPYAGGSRMHLLPHDLDTVFGLGDTGQLAATTRGFFDATDESSVFSALLPLMGNITIPGNATFRTKYFTVMRELLGGPFDSSTTGNPNPPFHQFIDYHIGKWVPEATLTYIKNWATARQAHLLGILGQSAIPPTAPTSNSTAPATGGSVIINEILASNVSALNHAGTFPDVIELRNTSTFAYNLSGRSISDNPQVKNKFIFPAGTVLPAQGILLLYADSNTSAPGIHLGFSLKAEGGTLGLYDTPSNGQATLDLITYGHQIPNLSIGRVGSAWTLCNPTLGTATNTAATLGSPSALRINEWLGNADFRVDEDFVELYNSSTNPVALGGMRITDDAINFPTLGLIPPLSFIAGNGFLAFKAIGQNATPGDSTELPFKLNSTHGTISLLGSNGAVADRVDVVSQFRDVSMGRLPDGSATLSRLAVPSPGFSNAPLSTNDQNLLNFLRITELHYHPELNSQSEYIELHNISDLTTPVTLNLSGVTFVNGITYTFPAGTSLAAGATLVLAGEPTKFSAQYPAIPHLGPYTGKLDNKGERIRLDLATAPIAILDFRYSENWYPTTNGGGAALQIVDDAAPIAMWDKKAGWQATLPNPGGSPAFSVSAGFDRSAHVQVPVFLDGALQLGPYKRNQVTLAWTKESGPGVVTFTTPNYEDANARFSSTGVYVLKLTATGPGGVLRSDTVQVFISESYAAWVARTLGGQTSANQDKWADPDRDGFVNLLEYATGTSPTEKSTLLRATQENGSLVVRYTRSLTADPAYVLDHEFSEDLQIWIPGAYDQFSEGQDASTQHLKLVSPWASSDVPKQFIRLRITDAP